MPCILQDLGENHKVLEQVQYVQAPGVLFALETANKKYNTDAVYFRSLRGNVIPQVYIFDYTTKILTPDEKNKLHIKMWNGFQVPVYMIIEKDLVSVFDSRQKPNTKQENYAEAMFKLAAHELNRFNASGQFDNGLFWEDLRLKDRFNFEDSAARDLIRGLKSVYKDFHKKSSLDKHIALKLLVQSLLIKYLEERDENEENGYFTKHYFDKHFRCEKFCEVIRAGKLLDLLDRLAADFNGRIFLWDKNTADGAEARRAIKETSVICLAGYLDGNIQNEQFVFWRLYSFSHLPVEIISSVYEELLTNSRDVVYTPEMVVDVMIDECMPLGEPVENFKLIDVSCGSGIFLVKAYKRIIQWWRYEQWKKTGILAKPSLEVLKRLLETSIYGIDIQKDAVNLAVFSLALALLDEVNLNPPTWENLKFPDLSKNIAQDNFFHYIMRQPKNNFDLVIGNPPFNLPPEKNGKEPKRKEYFDKLKGEIGYKTEISIPDKNPALHFLLKSMELLKQDALLCLIQPSGAFLYQNNNFKQKISSKYNVLEIIDFTKLSDVLWRAKKVAAAAVFIQNSPPDKNDVLHIIANKLPQNTKRLFLEFDYYDFNLIDKESVQNNPRVWKINLLGGGQRLVFLVEWLSKLPTLYAFLKERIEDYGWKYSEGYAAGNKKQYAEFIYPAFNLEVQHP
jgi:type I restriction-modification system DNA methylase subunit